MADKGDVNLKHLSGSTDGMPIVITGTAVATATVVHTSTAGTTEVDLVTLLIANTDESATLMVGVVVYTGTPADPTHVVAKIAISPKTGAWVALDGAAVGNGKIVGVYCATASKITAWGRVGRATL